MKRKRRQPRLAMPIASQLGTCSSKLVKTIEEEEVKQRVERGVKNAK
jgi:hypothetical protein